MHSQEVEVERADTDTSPVLIRVLQAIRASLVAQLLKNPPALWETWIRSLGWEDSLEKGKVTHSSILAWRIPWIEEPGGLQSMGSQRAGHGERLSLTQTILLTE